jgi:hypothetical protein
MLSDETTLRKVGVVALSFSKALNRGTSLLLIPNPGELERGTNRLEATVTDQFRGQHHDDVVGILAHLSTPAVLESETRLLSYDSLIGYSFGDRSAGAEQFRHLVEALQADAPPVQSQKLEL